MFASVTVYCGEVAPHLWLLVTECCSEVINALSSYSGGTKGDSVTQGGVTK